MVSTRETSPASSTHYSLEATSAARELFISCPDHHHIAAELPPSGRDSSRPRSDISRPRPDMSRPRPGLHADFPSPLEMNPNPFQSVNDRRSKLAVDNPRPSHALSTAIAQGGSVCHRPKSTAVAQPIAPIAPLHPSSVLSPPSTIPRGASTTNWRSSTTSLDTLITPSPTTSLTRASVPSRGTTDHRLLAAASSSDLLCSPISTVDFRNSDNFVGHDSYVSVAGLGSRRPSSTYHHDIQHFDYPKVDRNTSKMHPKSGKIIADSDMDRAMCYCYDRGGGQYTRLVPVDMLPVDLQNMPRRVNNDDGMIILPIPRQPGPHGQLANIQLETQPVVTVSCSVPVVIGCV